MTFVSRLGKLTSALTGKERAVLVLRARNAGQEPDPELLQIADQAQRHQYDRYVALAYVANAELGALCFVIGQQAEYATSVSRPFEVLQEASGILADELQETVDPRKIKGWRHQKEVTVPEFLAGLAEELRLDTLAEVRLRWQELRALDMVWDAIRDEFDGEDPVQPTLRESARATAETLQALAQRCGLKKLPEPTQAFLDRTWGVVDRSYDALKLVKD